MLVEDDKSLREIYGIRLLAEGYEITSAGDGEQALAMAVKEHPDLILTDVMMPKISGFDMLDILRATPETKNIKVIMMTALSSEDQRARGESLGADRYLVKSQVGIEDVVRTVHDVLADTPATAVPAGQRFGLPVVTAAIKPRVDGVAPRPAVQNTPQNVISDTLTSNQQSAAINPLNTAPTSTAEAPKMQQPTQLPQPTAPFSTPNPANVGEKVINPVSEIPNNQDVSNQMDKELNDGIVKPDLSARMIEELKDGSATNPQNNP